MKCLFSFLLLSLTIASCNNKKTFKANQSTYEIKPGETFEINVPENPSTGYHDCWLAQNNAKAISLVKQEYFQEGSKDCDGCGGTALFTFKAIAEGTDTIKIANCPTAREQKDCSAYSEGDKDVEVRGAFIAVVKK